jgi:hypothetical protein
MSNLSPETGLTHLSKTALPLIGRIGSIAGGIVSLLAVFETLSGEISATLFGFAFVATFVVSAIIVFHQTTRLVEQIPTRVYSYSQKVRTVAAIVMTLAAFFLIGFSIRYSANLFRSAVRDRPGVSARATSRPSPAPLTPERVSKASPPTNAPSGTWTPVSPSPTLTVTPFPIDQMTDLTFLLKSGNDALAAKNYAPAVAYFSRALQIDATNARAQLGLGQAHYFLNNVNAAFSPLRTALQLNPALFEAHAYLGFVYDYRADFPRARAEYEEFLRVAPRDHDLRDDVSERLRKVSGSLAIQTLTPQPTLTATPTKSAPATVAPTLAK